MNVIRFAFPAGMAAVLMLFQTACEMEVGSADEVSAPVSQPIVNATTPAQTVNTGNTGNTGNNNNNTGNNGTQNPTTPAPGVPSVLSPGNGESFSGGGAKATLVWTDAERAVQFEVVVQGFGSGGWQAAAHTITDNFQYTYSLNNTAWTRYRWAVRSLSADSQASAFTAYHEFTWTP